MLSGWESEKGMKQLGDADGIHGVIGDCIEVGGGAGRALHFRADKNVRATRLRLEGGRILC